MKKLALSIITFALTVAVTLLVINLIFDSRDTNNGVEQTGPTRMEVEIMAHCIAEYDYSHPDNHRYKNLEEALQLCIR